MAFCKIIFNGRIRLKRAGRLLLRGMLVAAFLFCTGHGASAKQKPKHKKTAHSSARSSSRRHAGASSKKISTAITRLDSVNYPPELSARIADYNTQAREINAIRGKDPKMAKARGEVLEIQRESFELYANFIASMRGREADKIRKTVSAKAWYKGMPQIAFVVSMGLPDDVQNMPAGDGTGLKLVYKSSSFYFEKGRLRAYDGGHS